MLRQVIEINEEKCNGCGLCAKACHEGAIGIVDGKAKLLRDDYCDGMGDCLPNCPQNAISFIMRDALAYDEKAVLQNKNKRKFTISSSNIKDLGSSSKKESFINEGGLLNWPVQIKLAPVKASYFDKANLLIAADCCAYAYSKFFEEYVKNSVTLVGCSKLDNIDYSEKLTEIFVNNEIDKVTLTRMEVPCCGGLEFAIKKAILNSGKEIELKIVIISASGNILYRRGYGKFK